MANDCAGSLQVCALRVARLGPDGVPLPGSTNLYVTDSLVKLTITPVITAGDELELKNGCGAARVTFKDCDRLKRLDLEMEICTPDPELTELLVGGSVLTAAGQTRGYALPELEAASCPDGVSIEAWTKAIIDGHIADTLPYWRFVLPRTKWQLGPKNLENAIMTNPLTGFAEQNTNWYDGPANDWDFASDRVLQYARDTSIPAAECGYQVLAAS